VTDHDPLIQFMLQNPGVAVALIKTHFDDGHGFCRACALGAQRGYLRFPCDIRRVAEKARRLELQAPRGRARPPTVPQCHRVRR
jgi:hypothetical protein